MVNVHLPFRASGFRARARLGGGAHDVGRDTWRLIGRDAQTVEIPIEARVACNDFVKPKLTESGLDQKCSRLLVRTSNAGMQMLWQMLLGIYNST